MSGLYKRGDTWHIDKQVHGQRLRESTGAVSLEEAEKYLVKRIEEVRHASIYGIRPARIFREAATKYLLENQHKRTISDDADHLAALNPYIGHLPLERINMYTLQSFVAARRAIGRKTKTINLALSVVRRILNLAATEWLDEHALTWLNIAPKIKLFPVHDARPPYPLSWEEQDHLFGYLPSHLKEMALFKVNTGTREQEVCQLQWAWEIKVDELKSSVFLIPASIVKNGENRLVVLNKAAEEVINRQRAKHPEYVFTYRGNPIKNINDSGWCTAREKANLKQVRVHDLKHTFGRRLRAAGVGEEDRQDLLGHKSRRITTHYSAAEVQNLLAAANKACDRNVQGIALNVLKKGGIGMGLAANPHKIPTLH